MPPIRTLVLAAVLSADASPALADPWSFEVGAGTDNRSKEISKSEGHGFVFGDATRDPGGLTYAGAAVETIDSSTGSTLEISGYAGVRPSVYGFDLDLRAEYKHHVDADIQQDEAGWELTADVARSLGPAAARLRLQHSPDGNGSVGAWTWVEARAAYAVTDRLEASAAIGRRRQDRGVDYTGWNVGVAYALTRSLDLDLRYHDNDADAAGRRYADVLAATITYGF